MLIFHSYVSVYQRIYPLVFKDVQLGNEIENCSAELMTPEAIGIKAETTCNYL